MVTASLAAWAASVVIDPFVSGFTLLADRIADPWLAGLMATVLWHYCCEPARWWFYLRTAASDRYRTLFHVFSLTALVGYLFPAKLGLLLRIVLLRRFTGLPASVVSAWMFVDGLLYYAFWAIAALMGGMYLLTHGVDRMGVILSVTTGVIVCMLVLVVLWKCGLRLQIHPQRRFKGLARRWQETTSCLRRGLMPAGLLAAALVALSDVLVYSLRHAVLLGLLGHELSWSTVLAISSVSVFAGLLSLMPMGLGGYDLTLLLLLGHYQIPATDGIWVAAGNRAANLAVAVVLGGWSGVAIGIRRFSRSEFEHLADQVQSAGASSADKR